MRANVGLWYLLVGFFLLMCVTYTTWNIVSSGDSGAWYNRVEWVGSVALLFTSLMAALIAFYLSRVRRAQGGELPEDVLTSDIDDGDPEVGEFSPWSWWPIVMAAAAGIGMLGLGVGTWMFPIGIALFLVAIVGWVFEYYRGHFAR